MNRKVFNQKLSFFFLLVGFLLFSNYRADAQQCGVSNPLGQGESAVGGYYFIGQSFVACDSGRLETIRVLSATVGTDKTLYIYDGDGTGGTLLGSLNIASISASSTVYNEIDVSSLNILVNRDDLYTFYFPDVASTDPNGNGVNLYATFANNYPDGNPYYNNAPHADPDADLIFEVEIVTEPILSTTAASAIDITFATLGGNITDDGGATVTERGVVYSTTDMTPEIGEPGVTADTEGNTGSGVFSESITGLTVNTTYYYQAYATNAAGTSYGGVQTFKTLTDADGTVSASSTIIEPIDIPIYVDTEPEAIDIFDFTIADGGGSDAVPLNVTEIRVQASGTATAAEFGQVTWILNGPDVTDVVGTYATNVITFTGLSISVVNGGNEVYTISAYYNNTSGLTHGDTFILEIDGDDDCSIGANSTRMDVTSPVTNGIGSIIDLSPEIRIVGNGYEIADGDVTPRWDDHTYFGQQDVSSGTIKRTFIISNIGFQDLLLDGTPIVSISGTHASDFTVSTQPSTPVAGLGQTVFMISFDPSDYGDRNAIVSIDNNDSDEDPYEFNIRGTGGELPTVITTVATSITENSAESGGNVTDDGGSSIIAKGVCWDVNPNPNLGDNSTNDVAEPNPFTSSLTGLTSRTTYYYRAYATNGTGTAYGNEYQFTTSCIEPVAPTSISGTATSCPGGDVGLSRDDGTLNDADEWRWYSESCGGTYVGTGNNITVNPEVTTTYYVRAEGSCVTATSCASFTITVLDDNTPPTITCPIDVAVNNDAGNCTAVVNGIAPTAVNDDCRISSVTYTLTGATSGSGDDDASGTAFNPGVTTVEYTVNDGNGNTQACSFTVTVTDNENPVAITQDITAELDASGNVTITPAEVDNSSTDNCAITLSSLDMTDFDCSNIGANTVTLTVSDDEGNSDSQTATVTVVDNMAPVFDAYADITVCPNVGETTAVVTYTDPTATDNCTATPTITQTAGDASGSTFAIGTHIITYEAEDAEGNISTLSFNIIVAEFSETPTSVSSPQSPLCLDSQAEITLSYSGGTLSGEAEAHWYSDAALTDEVGIGNDVSVAAPEENTSYFVRFEGACNSTDAVELEVVVHPLPEVSAGEDATILSGETYQLEATNSSSYSYLWSPDEFLDANDVYNPSFTPTNVGEYTLTVAVTDENSCENSDEVVITVEPGIIKIYTGFTPNDDGHNDTWVIQNIETFSNSKVRVYDRNNALVFEAEGYMNDWRGTYDEGDGKTLLPGTYFFIIDLGDGSSAYKGTVTILSKR